MSIEHQLILKKNLAQLESITPPHMSAKKICRLAYNVLVRNPDLALCTPSTFFLAVATCVELGLEPGVLQHVAIIPFKKNGVMEAQTIPMYQGLLELARRSGELKQIWTALVREGDTFTYELGLDPILRHTPDPAGDGTATYTHAYAVAVLADGSKQFEVMTAAQILVIQKSSKAQNGPWKNHPDPMRKKTVLKQLLKLLPKASTVSAALTYDDHAEIGKQQVPEGLDIEALKDVTIPVSEPLPPQVDPPTRQSDVEPEQEAPEPPADVMDPPQPDEPDISGLQPHEMNRDSLLEEIKAREGALHKRVVKETRLIMTLQVDDTLDMVTDEALQELLHLYRAAA